MTEKEFEQQLQDLTQQAYKSGISPENVVSLLDMFLDGLEGDIENRTVDVGSTFDASQILFHVHERESLRYDNVNETFVYITPKSYFAKYGCQYDQYFDSGLPPCFRESSENIFTYKGTVAEARDILIKAGYSECPKFSAFIDSCEM